MELEALAALTLLAKSTERIAAALEERNKLLTPTEVIEDGPTEEPQVFRTLQTIETGDGKADRTDTSTWSGRLERNLEALKSRPRG